MSFGLSGKGRRSTPMTFLSRCNTRARCFPSRPQMPVIKTGPGPTSEATLGGGARGMEEARGRTAVIFCSPEYVSSRFDAAVDHRLNRCFHEPHLLLHDGVVVVRVSRESHRLAEIDAVLGG